MIPNYNDLRAAMGGGHQDSMFSMGHGGMLSERTIIEEEKEERKR